jgi:hypothetical protein
VVGGVTFRSLRGRAQDPTAVRIAGLLALGAFLLLLLSGRSLDLLGSPARIALVLLWAAIAVAFWLTGRVSIVVAYVVLGGLFLRWIELPAGGSGPSDHLAATYEALGVWFGGGNPYDHVYQLTRPPGAPVSQPPGELLVHLPGYVISGLAGVQFTQVVLAGVAMALFVGIGAAISWSVALPAVALYAGSANLIILATDGSNDTGTGAFLLLAIVALAWSVDRGLDDASLVLAGIIGGLAVATKQISLPLIAMPAIYVLRRHGRRPAARYLLGAAALLVLISLPFLVLGPATYVRGLLSFIGAHRDLYGWNIWTFAQGMGWTPWEEGPATVLNAALGGAALLIAVVLPYRSLAAAVLAGVGVTLVVLLTARWTTYAYFALLAPVVLALPALALWEARDQGGAPAVAA